MSDECLVRVHIQPISGVAGQQALCYLLEINGLRLLLDCGWDESFSDETIAPLRSVVGCLKADGGRLDVDAVLLSHATLAHLGGLPFLIGRLKSTATVYSTAPVHRMGQLALYDALLSRSTDDPEFDAVTLDDVDEAFRTKARGGRFVPLRFLQPVTLTKQADGCLRQEDGLVASGDASTVAAGALALTSSSSAAAVSVVITPIPAGHSLGACVWHIATPAGEESILYAVHFNMRAERTLPRLPLAQVERRPTLLITDACSYLDRDCGAMSPGTLLPLIGPPGQASAAAAAASALGGPQQGGGSAGRAPGPAFASGIGLGSGRGSSASAARDASPAAALLGAGTGAAAPATAQPQKLTPLDVADAALLEAVLGPLRRGGSVLLPVDSSARALELLYRLDSGWRRDLPPLLFLSPAGPNALEFARCMLEYMADGQTKALVERQAPPFELAHARVLASHEDVEAIMDGGAPGMGMSSGVGVGMIRSRRPVAVICSYGSLEAGPARALFLRRWAVDEASVVLFTDRLQSGPKGAAGGAATLLASTSAGEIGAHSGDGPSIAATVDRSLQRAGRVSLAEQLLRTSLPGVLSVEEETRICLSGAELHAWMAAEEEARVKAARAAAASRLAAQEAAIASAAAAAAATATATAATVSASAAPEVTPAAATGAAASSGAPSTSSNNSTPGTGNAGGVAPPPAKRQRLEASHDAGAATQRPLHTSSSSLPSAVVYVHEQDGEGGSAEDHVAAGAMGGGRGRGRSKGRFPMFRSLDELDSADAEAGDEDDDGEDSTAADAAGSGAAASSSAEGNADPAGDAGAGDAADAAAKKAAKAAAAAAAAALPGSCLRDYGRPLTALEKAAFRRQRLFSRLTSAQGDDAGPSTASAASASSAASGVVTMAMAMDAAASLPAAAGGSAASALLAAASGSGFGFQSGLGRGSRSQRTRDAIAARLSRLLPGFEPLGLETDAADAVGASASLGASSAAAEPSAAASADSAPGAAPLTTASGAAIRVVRGVPTKLARLPRVLRVDCAARLLPLDGRCDGPALLNLIESIAPQAVLVVGGGAGPRATLDLAADVRRLGSGARVLAPLRPLQRLQVSSRNAVLVAYLRQSLAQALSFSRLGAGVEVAHFAAQVDARSRLAPAVPTAAAAAAGAGGVVTSVGQQLALAPGAQPQLLLLAPDSDVLGARLHPPVLLRHGALRLSDLRRRLAKAGIDCIIAEGAAGEAGAAIVTSGGVIVRRAGGPAAAPQSHAEGHATDKIPGTSSSSSSSGSGSSAVAAALKMGIGQGPLAAPSSSPTAGSPLAAAAELAAEPLLAAHSVLVEGPLCEQFYAVRAVVRAAFTAV